MIFNKSKRIPTNIITGFLGTGKTTAILNLLKHKPKHENWAVLVNEFGEIGIDGSVFESEYGATQGVVIREVSGGCMCCTAGLSMQIALSLLLSETKVDRLLIEPTGLGHPKEVIEVLCSEHYQSMLALQKTIVLVDARMLSKKRITSYDTFVQQMQTADIVIANKQDLYTARDYAQLSQYIENNTEKNAPIVYAKHGVFDISLLEGRSCKPYLSTAMKPSPIQLEKKQTSQIQIPDCGFLKAENKTKEFNSIGWRFLPHFIFDYQKLLGFLSALDVVRIKAVFITKQGIISFNMTADQLTQTQLHDCKESKIEIIYEKLSSNVEQELFQCIVKDV